MPKLSAYRRRALEVLAESAGGCTEAQMVSHGFSRDLLTVLMLDGVASADTERVWADGNVVEVRRYMITDAGRVALEKSRLWAPNEGQVTVEYRGDTITGTYSARSGKITVTTVLGSKTTRLRGRSAMAVIALAEFLLRELAKEGRA